PRLPLRDVRRRGVRLRHRLHERHAGERARLPRAAAHHHQGPGARRGTQVPADHRLRAHRIRSGSPQMSRRAVAPILLVALLIPVTMALLATMAAVAQPAVARNRLPNGLTVVVRENSTAPVVAYSLLVKMGTRTETPDNAGISNMLQIMLVRGTEKMSGEEIVAAADRMGGTIDAYGDGDYAEITAPALSRNWQSMLELVGDVALRPTVPAGTLTGVRDFVVRQIRNRGDKPYDVATDRIRAALYGAHPYSWDPLGRRESVERLTRETLLAYCRRQYGP